MLRCMQMGKALAVVFAAAGPAAANKAPQVPQPPKGATTKLEIRQDRTTTKNRLIIPKKLLKSAKTVASLDGEPRDGNRLRTIFAGIALSLAAVSLIFVFMCKKGAAAKTAAGVLVAGTAAWFAMPTATADIAPPRVHAARELLRIAPQDVDIEISEKGDKVVLVLGTYWRSPSLDRQPSTGPKSAPTKTGAVPGKQ